MRRSAMVGSWVVGIGAMIATTSWGAEFSLPIRVVFVGVVFALPAFALALAFPAPSWEWGTAIVTPITLLLLLSVGFAGHVDKFISGSKHRA